MQIINGPVLPAIISELVAKASENKDSGAHSLFIGQVRREMINEKSLRAIEYSAYEEMVVTEADKIRKTILSEFDDIRMIEILHSKGVINAGEISLVVMISAGHRHQAMEACAKAVELVKQNLPVWKKEIFDDNTASWQNHS